MDSASSYLVVGWLALQAAALAIAWATRFEARPSIELLVQASFLAALLVVGVTAGICHEQDHRLWIPSATTLVVMVLTAVCDFRRTHEPSHIAGRHAHR